MHDLTANPLRGALHISKHSPLSHFIRIADLLVTCIDVANSCQFKRVENIEKKCMFDNVFVKRQVV
jgi:hypothetical protein